MSVLSILKMVSPGFCCILRDECIMYRKKRVCLFQGLLVRV